MRLIAALVIALVLALVAGCGGDDDEGGAGGDGGGSAATTTAGSADGGSGDGGEAGSAGAGGEEASPEKAAFVEEANQICVQNKEDQFAELSAYAEERPNQAQSELEIAVVGDVIVPSVESLGAELGELEPPSGDEQQVNRIVVSIEEVADAAAKSGGELRTKDFGEKIQTARSLARDYGLEECDLR